jgi:hypothetical protein
VRTTAEAAYKSFQAPLANDPHGETRRREIAQLEPQKCHSH